MAAGMEATVLTALAALLVSGTTTTAALGAWTLRATKRNERLLTGEEAAPGDDGVLGRLSALESDVKEIDERLPDPDRRSPPPHRDRRDPGTD